MNQQSTYTRPTPYRAAPTEPEYRLAGRLVSRSLHDAATRAKLDGRRVLLVLLTPRADDTDVPAGVCPNCLGAEKLGLDIAMSGPFKTAPSSRTEGENTGQLRTACYGGAWWLVTRHFAPCPLCADVREVVL